MPGSLVPFPSGRKIQVLDSWPMMEWLKAREPTASKVDFLIDVARDHHVSLILSTINLGEVYYNCLNLWGEARAEMIYADFSTLPIQVVHPTREDALDAARIKGKFKVAYGDCFAAVLAVALNAPVLTGDSDFLRLQRAGLIDVGWFGA